MAQVLPPSVEHNSFGGTTAIPDGDEVSDSTLRGGQVDVVEYAGVNDEPVEEELLPCFSCVSIVNQAQVLANVNPKTLPTLIPLMGMGVFPFPLIVSIMNARLTFWMFSTMENVSYKLNFVTS